MTVVGNHLCVVQAWRKSCYVNTLFNFYLIRYVQSVGFFSLSSFNENTFLNKWQMILSWLGLIIEIFFAENKVI